MELVCEDVGKQYGDLWALRHVSFSSGPGIVALVGPNGSGKTTLLRIIATLLPQTEGRASWNGMDTRSHGEEIRYGLGYLPQEFGLYPEFSARQFLRYMAAMKRLPKVLIARRVEEVLEQVNMTKFADKRLGTYSGGMKQRIGIAQALLNDPELLVVDEPTTGLDPEERVRFRMLLAGLTQSRLVLLSTHIISDVEAVSARLLLIREGQLLFDTTPEELIAKAAGQVWTITTDAANAARIQEQCKVSALVSQQYGIMLRILSATRPSEEASLVEPTLEDAYLLFAATSSGALTR
ncbi:MAG TPA: ABC transporter ATP-binding protein [Ktedonosporobacter sp.]|nr:ABC transporter ATP-binding protein [Ktedonosporobacter sp.]